MRSASSTQWSAEGTIFFWGVILLVLGIFITVHLIQTYAFYLISRSTIQGTVQDSYETTDPCGFYNSFTYSCESTTSCSTTIVFTPPSQGVSFTITDNKCDALAQGTKVDVLYDPNNPSTAETSRQASGDIMWAVLGIIGWPILAFIFTVVVIWGVLRKNLSAGKKAS